MAAGEAAIRKLTAIWQDLLGAPCVAPDQNYFDLGGDSSLAVQMFATIEKVFGIKLPLATLYDAPTIAELAALLESEASPAHWTSLVAIQPGGSCPPLFFFHGAGGNVLSFRDLARRLGPDQPVYGLQSQGLDGTSPLLTTIEDMAALYVKEIRTVQKHGPYLLGGYCMGGTLAYEAAQQLSNAGEEIALLALFDTHNWNKVPLTLWSKSSYSLQRLMFHAASFLELNNKEKAKFYHEKMSVLKNRIPVWRGAIMSKFGRKPDAETKDSLLLAKIWQTNDRASWNYIAVPFSGSVTDFRPKKQYRVFRRPDLKWDQLARGGQRVTVLPVYPAAMLLEPFVAHLASSLQRELEVAFENTRSKVSTYS
jgi:phthiocerol/phenolphthiocerol synthesis type-I polyketide synthase E